MIGAANGWRMVAVVVALTVPVPVMARGGLALAAGLLGATAVSGSKLVGSRRALEAGRPLAAGPQPLALCGAAGHSTAAMRSTCPGSQHRNARHTQQLLRPPAVRALGGVQVWARCAEDGVCRACWAGGGGGCGCCCAMLLLVCCAVLCVCEGGASPAQRDVMHRLATR